MAKHGYVFFVLSALFGYLSFKASLPAHWGTVVQGLTVLFVVLFLISLVLGRKIKFDPVLR